MMMVQVHPMNGLLKLIIRLSFDLNTAYHLQFTPWTTYLITIKLYKFPTYPHTLVRYIIIIGKLSSGSRKARVYN